GARRDRLGARQSLFLAVVERGHAGAAGARSLDVAATVRLGDDARRLVGAGRRALPRPPGRRLLGLHRPEVRLSALWLLSGRRALAGRRGGDRRRGADRLAAVARRAATGPRGGPVFSRLPGPRLRA